MTVFPALALCLTLPAANPITPAETDRAAALVRELGHPAFKVRERAAKQLAEMGRAAYPALSAGADEAESAEARRRCQILLPAAFDLEMKARLEAFLIDEHNKDHDLPGWARFRKLVGDSRTTRELFAGMVRVDARVMDAVENRTRDAGIAQLQGRCNVLMLRLQSSDYSVRTAIGANEIVQMFFMATHPDLAIAGPLTAMIAQLSYQPIFRQVLSSGDHAAAVKTILFTWADRHAEDQNSGYALTNLLSTFPTMKELFGPVVKIAANKKTPLHARCNALTVLGKVKNRPELVAALEPLLGETDLVGVYTWNTTKITTKICDVALATVVRLSGQRIGDYHFDAIKANPSWVDSYVWQGFKSDADRAAARAKWDEWKSKQKK